MWPDLRILAIMVATAVAALVLFWLLWRRAQPRLMGAPEIRRHRPF